MKCLSKKKSGSTNIWIAVVIGTFLMLVVFVALLEFVPPIKAYIDMQVEARKYLGKMEVDGYLTGTSLTSLENELAAKNFNMSNVTVTAEQNKVNYGDDVTIEIHYIFKRTSFKINGMAITTTQVDTPMNVILSTVSKNGS